MPDYRYYSLIIRSDIEMPELLPASGVAPVDVVIKAAPVPEHPPDGYVRRGVLFAAKEDGAAREPGFWLSVPDIGRFQVEAGMRVSYQCTGGHPDALRLFLLGSCTGAMLAQRGLLVLHGNAFTVGEDGCVICVGPSGVGKSTLVAAMMQRGHAVLADDLCPVDAEGRLLAGMPRIKLWEQSAQMLNIDTGNLRAVRPELKKYNYPLGPDFCEKPRSVRMMYVLESQNNATLAIDPIEGLERFQALKENTYRFRYLVGAAAQARHMQHCAALGTVTAMARLTRPQKDVGPHDLTTALQADLAARGLL